MSELTRLRLEMALSCLQSRWCGGCRERVKSPHRRVPQSISLLKKEASTAPDVLEVSESPADALGSTITQEDYCSPGDCTEPEESPPLCLTTNGGPCEPLATEPQLQKKLKQLQLGRDLAPKGSTAPTDPSCLLTPPTTPLNFDSGSPEPPQGISKGLQDPRRNGMNGTKGSTPEGTKCWGCPALGVQDWGTGVWAALPTHTIPAGTCQCLDRAGESKGTSHPAPVLAEKQPRGYPRSALMGFGGAAVCGSL